MSAKVAVVMAVYKPDPEFLKRQLVSLATQTHLEWFLVVHDDSSMSLAELRELVGQVVAPDRVNVAQGAARVGSVGNFGAALALVPTDCALIAFCDQDDEWEPSKLARLVREFSDVKVVAAHSDLSLIDREGRKIGDSCWHSEGRDAAAVAPGKLILRNPVTGCALMFRSSLLPRVLPIPAQPMTRPDFFHDVWVALVAVTAGELRAVGEPLVRYRQHGGNVVGAQGAASLPPLGSVAQKCVQALVSRRRLEQEWLARCPGKGPRVFSAGFDLGIPIFARTLAWSLSSRAYWRIGLQLALGKFLWDCGLRPKA